MPTIITIVGHLAKDPEEIDYGPNKNVTRLRVACSDSYKDENGDWKDADTAFYNVSAWRNLGKNVASSLKKGDKVIVQGKMKYSEFKRPDGTNGNSYGIDATDIGVALTAKTAGKNKTSWGPKETSIPKSKEGEENPWA